MCENQFEMGRKWSNWQIDVSFHGSLLLLIIIFVITLSKYLELWIHVVIAEWIRRLLWQCDDELYCQLQDRHIKNWHQFVFYDNKLSNFLLSLADASHEFQIHVSVCILTIKINQWVRMSFCSYRKIYYWSSLGTFLNGHLFDHDEPCQLLRASQWGTL